MTPAGLRRIRRETGARRIAEPIARLIRLLRAGARGKANRKKRPHCVV